MTPTSVFILQASDRGAPDLAADFGAAGFTVRGSADCAHLVRDTLRAAPDVVVCWAPRPVPELLEAVATLQAQQCTPLLFFTADSDVATMQRALEAGVHAWVVQGYDARRLRPLVRMAQARAAREQALQARIAQLDAQLQERKWVDTAKGILMRAQRLGEDEAFRLLRTASMQGQQRVGELSRQVIAAARLAEAVNRAGQQRMLSQRLVKLQALACAGTDPASVALLLRGSIERVEENLARLGATLAPETFGDLLAAAQAGWQAMRTLLQAPACRAALADLDRRAQDVLAQADALVLALESSGAASQVHVVNTAGRQRMLSQRVAKLALLRGLGLEPGEAALAEAVAACEAGWRTLQAPPLSTPEIRDLLARGSAQWGQLRCTLDQADTQPGRLQLAAASEDLLELCDRLTEACERSVAVLLGG